MATPTEDPLAPFRSELRAHCYRMMGSAHDAEDVLQEVSLRAWRGRERFEGRSALRTWLHRIVVNTCLNELDKKERRVLPIEYGPANEDRAPLAEPLPEVPWLEPLPDDPEQSAADRETVELAFVAAVQHLAPNQRAALILFDVLGFSAREVADAMGTTPQSVNSALQRARATLEGVVPDRGQQTELRELGDDGQRELVTRYSAALRGHDVDGILALLTEDATWSMPPIPSWYRGHDAIAAFMREGPFTVRWNHHVARVNGQLAVGCYAWDDDEAVYLPYALDVLELRGGRIAGVTAFLGRLDYPAFGLPPSLTD